MTKKILLGASQNSSINSILALAEGIRPEHRVNTSLFANGPAAANLLKSETSFSYIGENRQYQSNLAKKVKQESPDLIVVGTSIPDGQYTITLEQELTKIGKEQGIKTLSLLDYVGSGHKSRYPSDEYTPDTIIAPDEWTRQILMEEGFKTDIQALGNPQYDRLKSLKETWSMVNTYEVREALRVPEKTPGESTLVTFVGGVKADRDKIGATTWDRDYVDTLCQSLMNLRQESRKKAVLLLRPHPRQLNTHPEEWDAVVQRANEYDLIVHDSRDSYDPEKVALASDLTVVFRSNIATTTAMMGLKTLSIQPGENRYTDNLGVNGMGAIPVSYSLDSALDLVPKSLQNGGFWKPFSDKRNELKLTSDGKSTERVLQKLVSRF